MTLRDISVAAREGTPEWPGDSPFVCRWTWAMAAGASVNVSAIHTSPHVGTHADAPLHVREGAAGADRLPLDAFVGRCVVVSVDASADDVGPPALESRLGGARTERVLLRTGATIAAGAFPARWPALTADAARWLVARGVRLVGVDAPSVDRRESTTLAVHHALFDGGAYVLENLDLRAVADGEYVLIAPPLKVGPLDAAPVRALLADDDPTAGR
ncbi:MAG TPA: cyclase family protein [Gemmatimonadaceae bacterium]|nr:cyclase family protein [Gemmatimonadaceae bacterium]